MSKIEKYDRERPEGGIYDLPVLGAGFRKARGFYDDMEPMPGDSAGVVVGKQAVRYGTVAGTTVAGFAAGCMIVL